MDCPIWGVRAVTAPDGHGVTKFTLGEQPALTAIDTFARATVVNLTLRQ